VAVFAVCAKRAGVPNTKLNTSVIIVFFILVPSLPWVNQASRA
jgi:hypothetical protein